MAQLAAKVSSAIHTIGQVFAKVSGVYKPVLLVYVKQSGAWQLVFSAFSPHSNDFTTTGTKTVVVPVGAVSLTLNVTGGGGCGSSTGGPGGGAGGTATLTSSIIPADWGTNIICTVGMGGPNDGSGDGQNGSNSTCAFTINAGSFSLTGDGGIGGRHSTNDGGTGGTAFGGDTNTPGGDQTTGVRGGDSIWALGGTNFSPDSAPGILGSGGGGDPAGHLTNVGGVGRVKFDWS